MKNDVVFLKVSRDDFIVNVFSKDITLLQHISSNMEPYYSSVLSSAKNDCDEWKVFLDESDIVGEFPSSNPCNDIAMPDNEPERRYISFLSEKIIIIDKPNDVVWKLQHAYRLIRVLSRIDFFNSGMRFYHGGFINYKNRGVALLGDKCAGKTSSILSALTSVNTAFITNDDIGLCQKNGRILGAGWPRAISIREDTKNLPHLHDFFQGFLWRHPANNVKDNTFYSFMYPKELALQFGRAINATHQLDIILFPSFSHDVTQTHVRKLDEKEIVDRLKSNHQGDFNKYSGFLSEFVYQHPGLLDTLHEFVSKNVLCFEVKQNFKNLASFTAVIDNIIEEQFHGR